MTDELMIQQDSAGSYAGLGAGIGAVAGGFAGHFSPWGFTKPRYESFEDILKESEDTFKKEIDKGGDNKAFWEKAKEQVQKVKAAEAEYDQKVSEIKSSHGTAVGQLPEDNEAAKKLKEAQTNYDNRLAELTKAEEKKLGASAKVTSLPTSEEMRQGIKGDDAVKVSKDWEYYDRTLKSAYEDAVNEVKTNPAAGGNIKFTVAQNSLNGYKTSIGNYYKELAEAEAEKDPKQKTLKFRNLEKTLDTITSREYKYAADNELLEKAFKEGKMQEKKGRLSFLTAEYTDPKTGKKYVLKDGVKLKDLRKANRDAVDSLRENLAEEIKASHSAYSTAAKDMRSFEGRKEFRKTSKSGHLNTYYVCELTDIRGAGAVETYQKQAEIMKKLADPKKASKVSAAEIDAIRSMYGLDPKNISEHAKISAQINSRLTLAKQYAEKSKALSEAMGGQSRINFYKTEMEKAIQSNKDVKKAAGKIKVLARKYGINIDTTAADDIAEKAKAAAEEAIKKDKAAELLKNATDNAAKEAEKLGLKAGELTEEELAKVIKEKGLPASAGEYAKNAKEAAQKALKNDLRKIKTPHKWVNAAIAAVVLGLVGCGIGSAVKKDA